MTEKELRGIGFKPDSTKENGILNFNLFEDETSEVFLQVSTKDTDVYCTFIVSQYDWETLRPNIIYLPMPHTRNIETVQNEIENLKRMFGS